MTTHELIQRHAASWRDATRHPFLEGIRDGSLPVDAFNRWLAQDYLFVADLLWFQARLLARAPRPAQAVLGAGLVEIEAELGWFEQHARTRRLALDGQPAWATQAYRTLLQAFDRESFATGMVALWSIERAYQEAWATALPGAERYRDFVEHWTMPAFVAYVERLQQATDAALQAEQISGQEAFLQVAQRERGFWEMALGGQPS